MPAPDNKREECVNKFIVSFSIDTLTGSIDTAIVGDEIKPDMAAKIANRMAEVAIKLRAAAMDAVL